MSDDAYSSFLDQANQDTNGGKVSTQSKKVSTKAVDTNVPAALKNVDAVYTSDSDEAFEPVSLKWEGKELPGEREFGELIEHNGEVEKTATKQFDPRGQYGEVLEAVEQASESDVVVFRVQHQGTRAEYYLVGLAKGKIVGFKVLAIES
ncbi:uncharacterized protein KY384_004427 [Bacidia gigantensis]|uniref:uncharacterized protein n=1 Tax=Bacidia gigantensis TaxID=2732470 RepID=UPI001D057A1D|nr:uncharacterized protein KY384_004427 [Bacidia gigantensis]KAG8531070.1 hypothetical protein KY384_004427 [Bacidia gigantensis]